MTCNRRLFDSYKLGLKFDIQDETDVTRNPAYTVACEDCMHVIEGRNRNSVYVGSNYVVIDIEQTFQEGIEGIQDKTLHMMA